MVLSLILVFGREGTMFSMILGPNCKRTQERSRSHTSAASRWDEYGSVAECDVAVGAGLPSDLIIDAPFDGPGNVNTLVPRQTELSLVLRCVTMTLPMKDDGKHQ